MSHTVHPYSHRLGIIRDWKSKWFGDNKKYREYLKGDILIREHLDKKLITMHVSDILIERSKKGLRLIIKTSRPGLIIGRSGEGLEKIRKELVSFMRKKEILDPAMDLKIEIDEVRSPESDARLVGLMVKEALEKKNAFQKSFETNNR
jgi:small subunit ribosomal protein S3